MSVRNRITQVLRVASWEVTGLANPLFLILLSFTHFFFIPSAFVPNLILLHDNSDPFPTAAQDLFTNIAGAAVAKLYVPLILIVSLSMTNTLTREFDSGLAKFYLSLPVSRLAVLLGKLLANFLLVYLVEVFACLTYAYLMEPSNFLNYVSNIDSVAVVFLHTFFELFFILGVTTWVCTLAPKSWVAVVLSTLSLYSFMIVNELQPRLKWYLPPYCFMPPFFGTYTLLFLAVSAVLFLLSTYLFVRRVEVS
ncbi:MAG: ABC transporter permease subunit [Thermoproteota archaeon]